MQLPNLTVPLLLLLIHSTHILLPSTAATINIVSLGARPDGQTDSTRAVLAAWVAACGSAGPSVIYVPLGRFLLAGRSVFTGPCRASGVTFRMDGTLVAPPGYGEALGNEWLLFDRVTGVSFFGGSIDGQGAALWACKQARRNDCPSGPASLVFQGSRNIVVSGLTSLNSKLYHLVFNDCTDISVSGVRIMAPGNAPNTDGIHVQMSTGVTITGTGISTGDDCVSIGPGTQNLWIERVTCGPGHGISIGSLGKEYQEAGVSNVTVTTVVFTGTENGLRIKTWARPSTGFVRGVRFQHAVMQSAKNPVIINQNYCEEERQCPGMSSGIRISDVAYNDIQGTSATPVAIDFDCSPTNPCTAIALQDIRLAFGAEPARAACQRVSGTKAGFVVPPGCF